ncbi:MAG TPA: OFA family MFS transporter [Urbifossiella sp.]|nr:OFA family MFS transporter [Urbifossiella sp.]
MASTGIPLRAWVVTGGGMTINLCLGILYAWSVWKANLVAPKGVEPGSPMSGLNAGWVYLSDSQATWAYAICGFTFALFMVPGGRLQDRFGPRVGATLAGVCLGLGCWVAGTMKSYPGLVLGFGVLGGIGMGLGYAAATPAAVRWFGPHRRGLIAGLVVAGYGGAAIYIAPLAKGLIAEAGISGSFFSLGAMFAAVIVVAGQFLKMPPADYLPPTTSGADKPHFRVAKDRTAKEMLGAWQYFTLVFLFIASAQAGLLVIANAALLLKETSSEASAYAWMLASFGGLVNASGRIGTGFYSDAIGRTNALALNGLAAAVCLFFLPTAISSGSVVLLFVMVGIAFWQYGGTLSLMPAWTADFFGAKNLGLNYGLVFLGWGIAFFVPQLAAELKDVTGRRDESFYLSGALLLLAIAVSRFVKRPA